MRCVIIAGSPDADINFINETVKPDDFVICADKGCEYARAAKLTPDLVVSDFDSCGEKIFPDCATIKLNSHKDDTDTMCAVKFALEHGYRDIIILCATGGRLDHTLGNVATLKYIAQNGAQGALLSPCETVRYLKQGNYRIEGLNNKTFSLLPFGCESVTVSYEGALYPLCNYKIDSSVTLGVSNVFTSDDALIEIYDGNAILVINLSDL